MGVVRVNKYEPESKTVKYSELNSGDTFLKPGTSYPIYVKLTAHSVVSEDCISASITNGQTIDFDEDEEFCPVDLYVKYKYQEM